MKKMSSEDLWRETMEKLELLRQANHPVMFRNSIAAMFGHLTHRMSEQEFALFCNPDPCGAPGCDCHNTIRPLVEFMKHTRERVRKLELKPKGPFDSTGMKKVGPGVYTDNEGTMHINSEEICKHLGMPVTKENCELVEKQALEVSRENNMLFGVVSDITPSDLPPAA